MSKYVTIKFRIPVNKMELLISKGAKLSTGGLRLPNGEIAALAEPVTSQVGAIIKTAAAKASGQLGNSLAQAAGGPILAGINALSSIAGNVQCAFIQKGVNKANEKLDTLIAGFDRMEQKLDILPNLQALSAANLAVGVINCAVTVGGFYLTFKKLDQLDIQIKAIIDRIDQNVMSDMIQTFNELNLESIRHLEALENEPFRNTEFDIVNKSSEISKFLERTYAFLDRLLREIDKGFIDPETLLALMMKLSVTYTRILKEFSVQYKFALGYMPPNFTNHIELLKQISNNERYHQYVHTYVFSNNDGLTPFDRQNIYLMSKNLIPYELVRTDAMLKLTDIIGGNSYEDFCNRLTFRVKENISEGYLIDNDGYAYIDLK